MGKTVKRLLKRFFVDIEGFGEAKKLECLQSIREFLDHATFVATRKKRMRCGAFPAIRRRTKFHNHNSYSH